MFCNKLDVFGGDPRVVVGTNINPKIVGDYVCDLMNSLQVCSHLHSLQIWFGKTYSFQEAPAVVKSYYDKRIVGCPGGEGEDEHDVVWFWLEKGKSFECPVCTQYFELEVVGPGGPPDGHGDEDHDS
uniref:Uncharacterized protein n=1 Tax=Brassica campestris TaxID=3711 RepID=M4CBM1_BRACM